MRRYKHDDAQGQAARLVSFCRNLKITPEFSLTNITSSKVLGECELVNSSEEEMTGPTGHLLSPDGPVPHLHSLSLEFDNDTSESLGRDIISLHDPATIWPSRSLERRRAFQHLLNRCLTITGIRCVTGTDTQLDTTVRSSTDAKILVVRRPHVSAASNG